jgi:hypothetical protein
MEDGRVMVTRMVGTVVNGRPGGSPVGVMAVRVRGGPELVRPGLPPHPGGKSGGTTPGMWVQP